jgi:hypothetical protein
LSVAVADFLKLAPSIAVELDDKRVRGEPALAGTGGVNGRFALFDFGVDSRREIQAIPGFCITAPGK